MAGPGLVRGTNTQAKAILRLFIFGHRLGYGLYRIAAARSRYRHTRFRDIYRCGLWTARRLAGNLYQYMVTGATMASL